MEVGEELNYAKSGVGVHIEFVGEYAALFFRLGHISSLGLRCSYMLISI